MVGTTIEWYDFFIYANAAALVFAPLFFSHAASGSMSQIAAFVSVGISFLFRPIGAAISGHLGDRIGRKKLLVLTLLVMGIATVAIGFLPTAEHIGMWAPALLILLRILQGLSTGGEWGAAALMAVEHAPSNRRGFFGAFPQLGAAVGMLMATAVLAIVSATTTTEQFMSWGWRIPFIGSVALMVVGLYIRRRLEESPVFDELAATSARSSAPIKEVFRSYKTELFQAAWIYAGVNVAGYMILGGYILNYTTKSLGMDRTSVLWVIAATTATQIIFVIAAGALSDRIGRVPLFKIGFVAIALWVVPMFLLIETATLWGLSIALLGLSTTQAFAYGQQAAAFVEMFPARVRFTGASLGYALGAVIGGGFAPTIASALQNATGSTLPIAGYIALWSLIALTVIWKMKDRTGQPISASDWDPDHTSRDIKDTADQHVNR